MVKKANRETATSETKPNSARIAIVSFPEDPDIKPYRDVVYFFYPTKH